MTRKIVHLIFLITLTSCNEFDDRVELINNSNDIVRYHYELKEPKDTIPDMYGCDVSSLYFLGPNESKRIHIPVGNLEDFFQYYPSYYLRVYIINQDSLKKYGACKIFERQLFLKRFDYRYYKLRVSNWRVEYIGDTDSLIFYGSPDSIRKKIYEYKVFSKEILERNSWIIT
jgi:hypothetical protein